MLLGVLGDFHRESRENILRITTNLVQRGVSAFIVPGDIEAKHLDEDLFHHLPVVCALVRKQHLKKEFCFPPSNWCFTKQHQGIEARLVNLGSLVDSDNKDLMVYVGHNRSMDVLNDRDSFIDFLTELDTIRGGIEWIISGHTHHQFSIQRGVKFWINPGSVEADYPAYAHEFAVVDTESKEIVFSRIPKNPIDIPQQTLGIISDTGTITATNPKFWEDLRNALDARGATSLIINGLLARDIGRPELEFIDVCYDLVPGEEVPISDQYKNWRYVDGGAPVAEVLGHRFLIQHSLGPDLAGKTEIEMMAVVKELAFQHHQIDYVISGGFGDSIFEKSDNQGRGLSLINPGDVRDHRKLVTICFPQEEITFTTVPFE